MKLICSLILTCLTTASAFAADAEGNLRERRILCGQFVIEDFATATIPESADTCCRIADRGRDCHLYDWDVRFRRVGPSSHRGVVTPAA
jgi:hypothetical protein